MSIINRNNGMSVAKALDIYSGDDLIGFYFDNQVTKFIRSNLELIDIIDLDTCEDLFQSICKNMNIYSIKSKEYKDIKLKQIDKLSELHDKRSQLRFINTKDSLNFDKLALNNQVTEEAYEQLKETTDRKIKARDEYIKVNNEYAKLLKDGDNCFEEIEECRKQLSDSYDLLIQLYDNIKIDSGKNSNDNKRIINIHDFTNESKYELYEVLEKTVCKNAPYILNELNNLIMNELVFYTDLFEDLKVFSFEELTDEKLEQLNVLSKKYKQTREIIDLKYDTLKSFFIDSYNTRHDSKANINAPYKKVLYFINEYLDDASSKGINEYDIDYVSEVIDRIDNTSPQGRSKVVANRLAKMYSRHIKIR